MRTRKSQKIEDIRKKFHNEWLLIKVTEMDETTTTPIRGQLITHNPDRDVIYKKSMSRKGPDLIEYSEDVLPKGYAYAM